MPLIDRRHPPPLLIDDSLSLINRTGAHYIARDLVAAFGADAVVRRWRRRGAALPGPLARRLLGRAMLAEMRWLKGAAFARWPSPRGATSLFLDPLYVLRARLSPRDIVLCHDIGPLTLPSIYDDATVALYRCAYERVAAARPGMVFVSEASRRAFVAAFGDDFRFLRTIPLYVRGDSADGAQTPVAGVREPFLLSVGALERRKNHLLTIAAFERSQLAAQGVSLVVCGARGDAADDVTRLAQRTPGVRVLGYVADAELRWLYRHALGFVLPSLLEGFGLPALEAARHGLVPLVSQDGALAEAVGGHGLAVPATDPDAIASGMRRLVALDAAERREWAERLRGVAALATREAFLERWRELLRAELPPAAVRGAARDHDADAPAGAPRRSEGAA